MRRPLIAIAGLIAAAGLGALAANSLAGGEPAARLVVDADREAGLVAVESSAGPGGATRRAGGNARAEQLDYFQSTQVYEVAPLSEEAATLPCPKGYKAVGGFFITARGGTFLDLSSPQVAYANHVSDSSLKPSNRNWVVGVFNSTAEPQQVRFGVVCLQKRK
jgi:hypothetical protein